MILQTSSSSSSSFDFRFRVYVPRRLLCPCSNQHGSVLFRDEFASSRFLRRKLTFSVASAKFRFISCGVRRDSKNLGLADSSRRAANSLAISRFSNESQGEETSQESVIQDEESNFSNFREDLIVDKLKTQLGVIHPIPSSTINRSAIGLFVLCFFVGVAFDKLWTWRKRQRQTGGDGGQRGAGPWPQVPTSFSLFLEKDLQRKESVEWVNMVLGKLWKVYRAGIENWLVGLLQPVIDDLKKPDYVERVEIKQFSLGDEPLSVRNVERRTSRRANDLQFLQDTVPTDRIVVLRGGWSLFGKGSAGEILLRLTYKTYVEEEEDDKTNVKAIDTDASDDEMSNSEELGSFVRTEKVSSDDIGRESLMNVLSALIVSEEFQGIVSFEAENNKLSVGDAREDPVPFKAGFDSRSQPASADPRNGSESNTGVSISENSGLGSGDDGGLALLWFGIITGILVLVAINMAGSTFFNP